MIHGTHAPLAPLCVHIEWPGTHTHTWTDSVVCQLVSSVVGSGLGCARGQGQQSSSWFGVPSPSVHCVRRVVGRPSVRLSVCRSRVAENQLHTSAQKRRDKNESYTHTHTHTHCGAELSTHTHALAMCVCMCAHACIIQGRRHLADDCRQFVCSVQRRAVAFAASASAIVAAWCCWAARAAKTITGLVWRLRRRRWLWGPPSV